MLISRNVALDERGIAAVEFAMIAPVMIVMICGFMEYAHLSTARTTLEAATMRAARAVAASDCPSNRPALMLSIVQNAMADTPRVPGTQVEVVTKSYSGQFSDVGEPEPYNDTNSNNRWDAGETYTDVNGNSAYDTDMGRSGSIGGAGQVVSYTATFQVASLFGFINQQFNNGQPFRIRASTVIRNEPVFRTTGCT